MMAWWTASKSSHAPGSMMCAAASTGHFSDDGRKYFPNGHYRNQFWIEDKDTQAHVCLGVFGQTIYVAPEQGLVAVKLSTWPDFQDADMLAEAMTGFHAIACEFG